MKNKDCRSQLAASPRRSAGERQESRTLSPLFLWTQAQEARRIRIRRSVWAAVFLLVSAAAASLLLWLCAAPAYALTDSDVQQAVAAQGSGAVSGNVFIWFLCAIGFLKVSQKIDSLLGSLGLNISRTGGNLLGELLVAGRTLGAAAKAAGGFLGGVLGRAGSSGGSSRSQDAPEPGSPPAGESPVSSVGGVSGAAMRAAVPAAVSGLTGRKTGAVASAAAAAAESSIAQGGAFGAAVVGAVAQGSLRQQGILRGERAAAVLAGYLGYSTPGPGDAPGGIPSGSTGGGAGSGIDSSPAGEYSSGGGSSALQGEVQASGTDSTPIPRQPPQFRNVEIGGGRITGWETPAEGGAERQFAMYSAARYETPPDPYEVVQSADGGIWYRQYSETVRRKVPMSSASPSAFSSSGPDSAAGVRPESPPGTAGAVSASPETPYVPGSAAADGPAQQEDAEASNLVSDGGPGPVPGTAGSVASKPETGAEQGGVQYREEVLTRMPRMPRRKDGA